ncbi:MAG: hypothetical protein OXF02_04860 [Simkaniaceae bacterium]|nr:hypothetical protein [Simkaniaceae bacterium]
MASAIGASGVCVYRSGPYEEGTSSFALAVPPSPFAVRIPVPILPSAGSGEVARGSSGHRFVGVPSRPEEEKESVRERVVDAMVREPDGPAGELLSDKVAVPTIANRWVGRAYERERGSFTIPPNRRGRVHLGKVLRYIREGNVAIPEDGSLFRRRSTVARSKRISLVAKRQKAVADYVKKHPHKSYKVCVRDMADDPTILGSDGGAIISGSFLNIYVKRAYRDHRNAIMKGKIRYGTLLRALLDGRSVVPFSSFPEGGARDATETPDGIG